MRGFGPSDASVLTLDAAVERARRSAETGSECFAEGPLWRLRLWGFLPIDWLGNLSLHCHAARVSIVSGDARHLGGSRWAASLLVEPLAPGVDARALNLLGMARHRPAVIAGWLSLRVETIRVFKADGQSPVLAVSGRDQLGFVACVTNALLRCGLYADQLAIRTRGGWAEDWFALRGVGGVPAAAAAIARLRRSLESGS